MLEIGAIVWGVRDIRRAAEFWSEALNYQIHFEKEDFAILKPKNGKGVQLNLDLKTSEKPKRHHMDIWVTGNIEEEVERLLTLGAARKEWRYPPNADYIVLTDPDGNAFCLIR